MAKAVKWSILTEKEFKELDITLKKEYIKRYGRKFYKKVQNGVLEYDGKTLAGD